MIQVFRRIRQALIRDNKFSKYLLYAIGEIALVMIGIYSPCKSTIGIRTDSMID